MNFKKKVRQLIEKNIQASDYMAKNPIYERYDIGRFTYGKPLIFDRNEGANLVIGSFCSIASCVTIFLGGNHRTDWVTTYPFNVKFKEFKKIKGHPATKGDVIIGNDVWIGYSATILSGVSIGDGAVIGANAVVSKDIKPYAIVAGNPCIQIRKRFDDVTINELLRLKWWDWDLSKIKMNMPLLLSDNIHDFIQNNR